MFQTDTPSKPRFTKPTESLEQCLESKMVKAREVLFKNKVPNYSNSPPHDVEITSPPAETQDSTEQGTVLYITQISLLPGCKMLMTICQPPDLGA